jgi:SWI/SNF-related matrix-associated actin-dependent regulator 1 of chromatin subfamily A
VRRLKSEVLHELPDKYYSEIWVDLPPVQRRGYDQMRRDMLTWVTAHRDDIDNEHPLIAGSVAAQLTRLQQFAIAAMRYDGTRTQQRLRQGVAEWREVPVYTMTEPSAKLDAVMELITSSREQIVVFSQSKQAIHLLTRRLHAAGIPTSVITGDTSTSHAVRGRITDDFQQGKTRVFAGTIRACGEALTLTAASTVVFLDRDWNPSKNRQAEDRAHRLTQKNAVHVIDVMARNTIDLGRHQRIEVKWQWLQQILGDKNPTTLLHTAA